MLEYNVTHRTKNNSIQVIISYKKNGIWKQTSKQGFKNDRSGKKAQNDWVRQRLKELEKELAANISNNSKEITFAELCNEFINHNNLYKAHKTIQGYITSFNNFSSLNAFKMALIKSKDLQNCIDDMVRKEMCRSSIVHYWGKVKMLLNYYKNNYNSLYKVPNIQLPIEENKKIKKALTKSELDHLLEEVKNTMPSDVYIMCLLASKCGLRLGEILGVTVDNINGEYLTVEKQWKADKNGKFSFGALKTKNSYRTIPIPKNALETLLAYIEENDINGRIVKMNRYTFLNNYNYKIKDIAGITIHELRHTYATLLIANGIDFKTVAKLMGQDVKETMRTYSHVTDDMMAKATDKINNIF